MLELKRLRSLIRNLYRKFNYNIFLVSWNLLIILGCLFIWSLVRWIELDRSADCSTFQFFFYQLVLVTCFCFIVETSCVAQLPTHNCKKGIIRFANKSLFHCYDRKLIVPLHSLLFALQSS